MLVKINESSTLVEKYKNQGDKPQLSKSQILKEIKQEQVSTIAQLKESHEAILKAREADSAIERAQLTSQKNDLEEELKSTVKQSIESHTALKARIEELN